MKQIQKNQENQFENNLGFPGARMEEITITSKEGFSSNLYSERSKRFNLKKQGNSNRQDSQKNSKSI